MKEMLDNTIRIKTTIIVGESWRATFKRVSPQGECSYNMITEAGCSIVADGIQKNSPISLDTAVVPVRVCYEEESTDPSKDWCMNGSPLKETHFDNIPRWWPIDWLYNDGKLPDYIDINLGKLSDNEIILACEVIKKPKNQIDCILFSDVYIEGVNDQFVPTNVRVEDENVKTEEDDGTVNKTISGGNMFFSKKKAKEETVEAVITPVTNVQEEEQTNEVVTETVTEVPENNKSIEQSHQEENVMANTNETTEVVETKPAKKEIPTWVKVTGAVVITAAVAGGGYFIYKKVTENNKSSDSE